MWCMVVDRTGVFALLQMDGSVPWKCFDPALGHGCIFFVQRNIPSERWCRLDQSFEAFCSCQLKCWWFQCETTGCQILVHEHCGTSQTVYASRPKPADAPRIGKTPTREPGIEGKSRDPATSWGHHSSHVPGFHRFWCLSTVPTQHSSILSDLPWPVSKTG